MNNKSLLKTEFLLAWLFVLLSLYYVACIIFSFIDYNYLICYHATGFMGSGTDCPFELGWYEYVADAFNGFVAYFYILGMVVVGAPLYFLARYLFKKGEANINTEMNVSSTDQTSFYKLFRFIFMISPIIIIAGYFIVGSVSNSTLRKKEIGRIPYTRERGGSLFNFEKTFNLENTTR